jgi:hypothetical protein
LVKMLQPNTYLYIQYNNLRIRNVLILCDFFLIFEVFEVEHAIKTDPQKAKIFRYHVLSFQTCPRNRCCKNMK